MEKTMNRFQEDYMVAKAAVEVIQEEQDKIEKKYIADNAVVNPDGSVPELIYCIEDKAAFDKAVKECSTLITAAGLEKGLYEAKEKLKAAEDLLIDYGLSLAPDGIRATLERGIKRSFKMRQKILDLTLHLDISTVEKK